MIGIVMPRITHILIFITRLSQVLRCYLSGLHVWVFHMSDKNRCTWCSGSLTAIYLNVLSHWCWCILCGLLTGMATASWHLYTHAYTHTPGLARKSQMHIACLLRIIKRKYTYMCVCVQPNKMVLVNRMCSLIFNTPIKQSTLHH